jgi:hypothetical protein
MGRGTVTAQRQLRRDRARFDGSSDGTCVAIERVTDEWDVVTAGARDPANCDHATTAADQGRDRALTDATTSTEARLP